MDYAASEDAIITRLAPLVIAGCEVVPLPDTQGDARKPITVPRITVSWNGTDANPSQSTGNIIQSATVNFEITIQGKKKRGSAGVYALMQIIKVYLLGFESAYFGKMWVTKEEFADYDEQNVWNYRMFFSAMYMEIESDTGEADVILNQIDFNQNII